MIRFEPWSTTLGLGGLFALGVAAALLARPALRHANRWVATLLVVMALKIAPYALGYAGFYDTHPWLSFAPFDHPLALGPLLWLHVQQRTSRELPHGWGWHLLPPVLALVYASLCFVQPLAWKNDWNARVHEPFIAPALTLLGLLSLAMYLRKAFGRQADYQAWLAQHVSNADEHRFTALRALLLGLVAWVLLSGPYELATAVWRLDYFDRFGLYLALALLVVALGLEAWRHVQPAHPLQPPAPEPEPALPAAPAAGPQARTAAGAAAIDWRQQGKAWRARTAAEGWWRDPELSLESLARRLGTNTNYLSRAFNEGLGQNFSDVIGGLRVEWVCQRLAEAGTDPPGMLQLALDAGFASKSTFNRVFKNHTGLTPTAWIRAKR